MRLNKLLALISTASLSVVGGLAQASAGASADVKPAQDGPIFERKGVVLPESGRLAKAEGLPSQSESLTSAARLDGLGIAFMNRGDLDTAEDYLLHSLRIRQAVATESVAVSSTLGNLGTLAWQRGDLAKAEAYFRRALEIANKLSPGTAFLAHLLNNSAIVADERGDLVQAELFHHRALDIFRKLAPASLAVARSLNNLGVLAYQRANLNQAEDYFRQSLNIRKKLAPGSLDLARCFNNIGSVAEDRGEFTRALVFYRRALSIALRLAPQSREVANLFGSLGDVAWKRKQWTNAGEYYQRALNTVDKFAPQSLDAALFLKDIGNVAANSRDLSRAEDYYRRALEIEEKLAPDGLETAATLESMAGIAARTREEDVAAKLYERALDAFENQTSRLGGVEHVRAGFRAKHESYYKDYIDFLVARGRQERAFEVLERSRARTLLETLAIAHVDVRKGADPVLIEQERTLQRRLAARSSYRFQLLGGTHTDEQVKRADKEIADLLSQTQEIEGEIRSSSPAYAALTQPQPLTATQVQQQLLDEDTMLLEYSLGEERSHLFMVTPTTLNSYQLPKRTEIEEQARLLYGLLVSRNRTVRGEPVGQKQLRLSRARSQYVQAAAELSRTLLSPVAKEIGDKRLLIVADGALSYIPFAMLPSPDSGEPMVVGHEIVNLPSASVLAALRQQQAGRSPAPKAVAVLADPVFARDDSRVRTGREKPSPSISSSDPRSFGAEKLQDDSLSFSADLLVRSAGDVGLKRKGGLRLRRLPFSRREADAIAAVAPADQTLRALDFQASRSTAMSADLAQYRVVHFATHGLLDSQHPELSGLVLSLVDERGRPQNGFLELQDIYNMNLAADLVVLSACRTGLGKEVDGEGLVGLTRGFMYAGAIRVVASLWNVSDEATAQLMGEFYKSMEQKGMRPAAALRAAQIDLLKGKRWSDPYYWAAFQIQGEWK